MKLKTFADFRSDISNAGSIEAALRGWLSAIHAAQNLDPAIWISRFSDEDLLERARELDRLGPQGRPLFGMPFAVKDNIDVAGIPTTAACPAYAYEPGQDAPVVRALLDAGAICMGKTNLDQFATGLVGTRSPYGIPRNAVHSDYLPGGSSSGSAVAVARGLVAFSLGTDTAGSGRVPAAFNGIVGWKPTRGLIGSRGVVPACRSLDCVSVFTSTPQDCAEIRTIVSVYDPEDPWARPAPDGVRSLPASHRLRIAIPLEEEMEWFGDSEAAECWASAVNQFRRDGHEILQTSFRAFFEAARLLYEGPWVAERYGVIRQLLADQPEAVHPVTRQIIEGGARPAAWEVFEAMNRLAELRRETESVWRLADVLILPTTGTIYRISEAEEDPIRLNTNLGFYTNFFNLLDLCGLALPSGHRRDGLPFGITVAAPAFQEDLLFAFAGVPTKENNRRPLAVFGAHMRGLPLEGRLRALGGVFLREDRTAPRYRMAALDTLRPGVWQVATGGAALDLEVWSLPIPAFGFLLAEIPSPLGLGIIRLANDSEVTGFLCEASACEGKTDITPHGGWRAWKTSTAEQTTS